MNARLFPPARPAGQSWPKAISPVLFVIAFACVFRPDAARAQSLSVEAGTTYAWAGEGLGVEAILTDFTIDPYTEEEISWSLSGPGSAGATMDPWAYYLSVQTGPDASGDLTITATYGDYSASTTVYLHQLSGLSVAPDTIVNFDTLVTFTAEFDGAPHPDGPWWGGEVEPLEPGYLTATNTWTSGGIYTVWVGGGSQSYSVEVKALQLWLETYVLDEPGFVDEQTGFGVIVHGNLGEEPTIQWTGDVSGSGGTATYTPTNSGPHSATVTATVHGYAVSATAEQDVAAVAIVFSARAEDFSVVVSAAGAGAQGASIEIHANGNLLEQAWTTGVFSNSYPQPIYGMEPTWVEVLEEAESSDTNTITTNFWLTTAAANALDSQSSTNGTNDIVIPPPPGGTVSAAAAEAWDSIVKDVKATVYFAATGRQATGLRDPDPRYGDPIPYVAAVTALREFKKQEALYEVVPLPAWSGTNTDTHSISLQEFPPPSPPPIVFGPLTQTTFGMVSAFEIRTRQASANGYRARSGFWNITASSLTFVPGSNPGTIILPDGRSITCGAQLTASVGPGNALFPNEPLDFSQTASSGNSVAKTIHAGVAGGRDLNIAFAGSAAIGIVNNVTPQLSIVSGAGFSALLNYSSPAPQPAP